jgi:hypothetical protein
MTTATLKRFHINVFSFRPQTGIRLLTLACLAGYALAGGIASAEDSLKIVPATKAITADAPPQPAGDQAKAAASAPTARSYAAAYSSIPFSRAEYQANPSYRHDAAMELASGQLRPTTIFRNAPQPIVNDYGYVTPYSYYRNGYGYYGNGYYGGYRRSYNFYYPMPSVYRNY